MKIAIGLVLIMLAAAVRVQRNLNKRIHGELNDENTF